MSRFKVGIVDSGFAATQAGQVAGSAAFVLQNDALWQAECQPDQLAHGTQIVEVLQHCAPDAQLYMAQVFHDRLTTTASQVAAAIEWLVAQEVQLINLSLGLRTDWDCLRDAVATAVAAGVLICASSPAKGEPVFPAAYPGVLRTTGDARCGPGQWSWLDTRYADFAGHVRSLSGEIAGASIGTAWLCGHIARFMSRQPAASRAALGRYLKTGAAFQGAEQRGPDEVWPGEAITGVITRVITDD